MDKPVKQVGTLDYLSEFGVEFMGLAPVEHGWTLLLHCVVCGHTWEIASGRPLSPSQTTMQQSVVPRFLISVKTRSQYLAPSPSPCSPAHNPSTSPGRQHRVPRPKATPPRRQGSAESPSPHAGGERRRDRRTADANPLPRRATGVAAELSSAPA